MEAPTPRAQLINPLDPDRLAGQTKVGASFRIDTEWGGVPNGRESGLFLMEGRELGQDGLKLELNFSKEWHFVRSFGVRCFLVFFGFSGL